VRDARALARTLIELIKWRALAPGLVRSRNNAPRSAEDLSLSLSLSLSFPRRLSGLTHLQRSALTKFRPKFRAISTRHARPDSNSRRGAPLTARRADRAGHWIIVGFSALAANRFPRKSGASPERRAPRRSAVLARVAGFDVTARQRYGKREELLPADQDEVSNAAGPTRQPFRRPRDESLPRTMPLMKPNAAPGDNR